MNTPVRRLAVAALTLAVLTAAEPAWACPMCKAAAEADPRLPRAFMASILFMLGMPFTLLACFGIGFYRLSKRMPQEYVGAASADEPNAPGAR